MANLTYPCSGIASPALRLVVVVVLLLPTPLTLSLELMTHSCSPQFMMWLNIVSASSIAHVRT